MRFVYAVIAAICWIWLIEKPCEGSGIDAGIMLLSLAIVIAGALAGGD